MTPRRRPRPPQPPRSHDADAPPRADAPHRVDAPHQPDALLEADVTSPMPAARPGDLDPVLARRLSAAAGRQRVVPGDLGAVMARGRARQTRARAVAGAVAVVLVAGTATGVVATTSRDTTPLLAGDGGRGGPLTWRRVEPTAAIGYATGLGNTGGRYALSSAPGEASGSAPPSRVLYRSDDGIGWQPATTFGGDLHLGELASSGDRLYGVGTGTATAATSTSRPGPPELLVAWSDDRGSSFRRAALPVDMEAIAAKAVRVDIGSTQVVVADGSVVAVAVVGAELDIAKVLPDGLTATNGWALGDGGVDLLGPPPASPCPAGTSQSRDGRPTPTTAAPTSPGSERLQPPVPESYCFPIGRRGAAPTLRSPQEVRGVTRHLPFAELGVTGDLLRAVTYQPLSFVADEGSTAFRRVDLPPDPGAGGRSIAVGLSGGAAGARLVLGRAEPIGPPAARLTALRLEGRRWIPAPGPPGLRPRGPVGTLGGRTAVVGESASKNGIAVLAIEDGDGGWTMTELDDPADADDEGRLLQASIGPLGVAVVVGSSDGRRTSGSVRVSRDGIHFETWELDDLVGATPAQVLRVVVGAEQVQVAVTLPNGERPGPQPQVVVVGTPG